LDFLVKKMRHVRGQTQAVVHANCGKIWKDFSFQIQYNAIRISSDWTMWGRHRETEFRSI
jgi:nucleoside diphosphate kinase